MDGWNGLNIVWLIMAVVFFYFAILFWVYSRSGVRPFIFGSTTEGESGQSMLDTIPEDLQKEVESFRRTISITMETRFRIGAISMALGGLLALFSMVIG
jgi:hypothetical protein